MIKVAMLGFGTVGSGFYDIYKNSLPYLEKRFGKKMKLTAALVLDPEKYAGKYDGIIFTTDFNEVMKTNPDIIVEAMGGIDHTFKMASEALTNQIHYITANKDLVAEKGVILRELAEENKVRFLYEAAVAGGIPILKPIRECLSGDNITELAGIINGTSNYILSKMYDQGLSFDSVLKEAQELGYAESNPTSDVDGLDAGRKIAIMSSLGYGVDVDWNKIKIVGIRGVSNSDVNFAKSIDHKIKLIAVSKNTPDGVYASVTPTFVKCGSYFGVTDDVYNGVMVEADNVGTLMFMGKGAGSLPTGNSVFTDFEDALETHIYGKSLNNELSVGGEAKAVLTEYPDKCDWILVACNKNPLYVEKIKDAFKSSITAVTDNDELCCTYFNIGDLNEKELNNALKSIDASDSSNVKVYRVFGK